MGLYVVTGSASGIGDAVAKQIRAEGHQVIGVDIRDADIVADLLRIADEELMFLTQ